MEVMADPCGWSDFGFSSPDILGASFAVYFTHPALDEGCSIHQVMPTRVLGEIIGCTTRSETDGQHLSLWKRWNDSAD